jgi:hypothetical protein
MGLINFIFKDIFGRVFVIWHFIPKYKVPRWVRGKLYHQRYVEHNGREYKVSVLRKKICTYRWAVQQGHWEESHRKWDVPSGCSYFIRTKRWKKVKYFYRNI